MAFSRERILDALARLPFIDAGKLALVLGEPLATVHRALTALLQDGLAHRASHGTAILPSSHRYYLTKKGIADAADALGFDAPSDFVRAYPVSRQWLALLIRRMDAVASVYRLAATLSPGVAGLETQVEFQRRGRFDALITLHNGRSFGLVRQGMALRRRSLYDRLRAIAEYRYNRRPSVVLVLVPSPWEQRLTDEFCLNADLRDCYVGVERRDPSKGGSACPGFRPTGRLSGPTAPWSRWSPRLTTAGGSTRRRRSVSGPPCPIRSGWFTPPRPSASARRKSAPWT